MNPLFTDESMGGSENRTSVSWHALVLAMHLRRQLSNPWDLVRLLSDDTSTLVKDFTFMKPLQTLIQVHTIASPRSHKWEPRIETKLYTKNILIYISTYTIL